MSAMSLSLFYTDTFTLEAKYLIFKTTIIVLLLHQSIKKQARKFVVESFHQVICLYQTCTNKILVPIEN